MVINIILVFWKKVFFFNRKCLYFVGKNYLKYWLIYIFVVFMKENNYYFYILIMVFFFFVVLILLYVYF